MTVLIILENFSKGQAAFTKSKTYGFNYVDHLEYAEVGVQHIVPFIKEMESYLSIKVSTMVDPTKQIITPITNRTDTPSSPMQNMLDDSDTTYTQWKNTKLCKSRRLYRSYLYTAYYYEMKVEILDVR